VRPRRLAGVGAWPLNFTVRCPMERLRLTHVVVLALCQGFGARAVAATLQDNPSHCQATENVTIDARISTNSTFGELWEYHAQSGGAVSLRVNYLLSPMGEVTGSFSIDPGEINYMICVADAAQFFSLPPHIQTKGDSIAIDGPELSISIKRGGITRTVQVSDPTNLRNQDEVARFRRVWERIFKPLPLKPAWPGHLTNVGGVRETR
jgi:hypothetical protein